MLIQQNIDIDNVNNSCSYSNFTDTSNSINNLTTTGATLTFTTDDINNFRTGLNTWNNYNNYETISTISSISYEPKYNWKDVNNALTHINSLSQKYGLNVEYTYHVDDSKEMCDGIKFALEEINLILDTISTLMNACILNNDTENSSKLCDDLKVVLYFVDK